jgi:hypothetical protein
LTRWMRCANPIGQQGEKVESHGNTTFGSKTFCTLEFRK